jgi:hypothetical protein
MKSAILLPALAFAATVTLTVSSLPATSITFVANLSGTNENPPIGSAAPGLATGILDTDPAVDTITVDVTFSDLTSGATEAHNHCCLSVAFLTDVNVMVATTTPSFLGFPTGVTSGNYSHVFDLPDEGDSALIMSAFDSSGMIAGAEAALGWAIEIGR